MAKAMKTPAQVAEKWSRNLGAAGDSMQAGVQAVDKSPGESAAAADQKWIDGVTRARDRWKAKVRAVTLEQWKAAMIDKAIPRVRAGAARDQNKMQKFMEAWLPFEKTVQQQLASKPRGTLEQNIARAELVIRSNAAAKGKFSGK